VVYPPITKVLANTLNPVWDDDHVVSFEGYAVVQQCTR